MKNFTEVLSESFSSSEKKGLTIGVKDLAKDFIDDSAFDRQVRKMADSIEESKYMMDLIPKLLKHIDKFKG